MKVILLFLTVSLRLTLNAQTIGSFIDSRDGQKYKTVTYEIKLEDDSKTTRTWMAENLNFRIENSFCYDDYDSNCEIMGRLYTWPAAMKACPQGWHLPNDKEWKKLADLFGGVALAGTHLKSSSELWVGAGHGTNKSLFNAMPYGNAKIGSGYFAFQLNATFWSAEEISSEYATDWVLSDWDQLISYKGQKDTAGNSVRCVKD